MHSRTVARIDQLEKAPLFSRVGMKTSPGVAVVSSWPEAIDYWDTAEWDDLRQEAARLHNNRTAAYLLGKPMLADHLEEGLSQFGCSCEDYQGSWT